MDITKCADKECPLKDTCYRFTAKDSSWQSYFTESPIKGDKCEYYWNVSEEEYEELSECCGAPLIMSKPDQICSECGEHAEPEAI